MTSRTENVSITLPVGWRQRIRDAGKCLSAICRFAIAQELGEENNTLNQYRKQRMHKERKLVWYKNRWIDPKKLKEIKNGY